MYQEDVTDKRVFKSADIKIWKARRDMCRGLLRPVAKVVEERKIREKDQILENEAVRSSSESKNDAKQAFLFTAAAAAISATVLRVGGRAAFVQFLGLDFIMEEGIKNQMNDFISQAQALGSYSYIYFCCAWIFAKLLCIDALPVVLAMSSGIFFGGVLEGALLSTACATLASYIGFILGRTVLKEKVEGQMDKRPALRAIERAVSEEGFKTVLTLRLAPVLPVPIGAYNYIYGATNLSSLNFLVGMFLGSFKPYFIDAYLGVFGKSIIDNTGDSSNDYLVILAFSVTILVGTLATQVATRTWDEIQSEAALEASEKNSETGELTWQQLWGIETNEESLPSWYRDLSGNYKAAQKRIEYIIEEEWEMVSEEVRNSLNKQQNITADNPKQEVLENKNLDKIVPPVYKEEPEFYKDYFFESTALTFVLLGSMWSRIQLPNKNLDKIVPPVYKEEPEFYKDYFFESTALTFVLLGSMWSRIQLPNKNLDKIVP
eukprot:CAMPEP_0117751436 /NCGR_PEP_ID=MMETSP0947-20121206/10971_1 /TAXON_ID=44440 /ORGANISM="Chattonella subsalsa, Strain CCMP2191" /LENGTH=489 /DNA_ID=CAMNT_0005569811 /DNA_START=201 /DNA_END=1666 /DNA_ORIENTATION=+